ncbi:uromodulin-like [Lissotriton helveticus]
MKARLGLALALCFLCTASAQEPVCGTDELLNVDICDCDLSKYTVQAAPPDPTVQCLSGLMKLNVSKCQLEASKYNSDNLHLLDGGCTGVREVDGTAQVVVITPTSSTVCGNTLSFSADGSSVIYSNKLTIPGNVSASGLIARQDFVYDFTCSYPLKNIPVSLLTAIHPLVSSAPIPLPGGVGSVSVLMYAFTDASFTTAYTESSTLKVQDLLYLTVIAPELNADDFSLRVNRLFATGTSSDLALPQYDLITSGCPDSQNGDLVTINVNGDTNEAQFTVSVFQIAASDVLYFHASVEICQGSCTPACPGNGRSSAAARDSASLTMGPVYAETASFSAGSSDRFSWIWMVNFLMLSLLVQKLHQ